MSNTKLHVSRIPYEYPARELGQLFEEFVPIAYCDVHTSTTHSFAFVQFNTYNDALRAMSALDGRVIDGEAIRVAWSVSREDALVPLTAPDAMSCVNSIIGSIDTPINVQAWSEATVNGVAAEMSTDPILLGEQAPALDEWTTAEVVNSSEADGLGDIPMTPQNFIDVAKLWDEVPEVPMRTPHIAEAHSFGTATTWFNKQNSRVQSRRGHYIDRDAAPTMGSYGVHVNTAPVTGKRGRSSFDVGDRASTQLYGTQPACDGKRGRAEDEGW